MERKIIDQPLPALAAALALAVAAHRANSNAARALGVPVSLIGLSIAGLLAVASALSR